jgi:hypothetical protein
MAYSRTNRVAHLADPSDLGIFDISADDVYRLAAGQRPSRSSRQKGEL